MRFNHRFRETFIAVVLTGGVTLTILAYWSRIPEL